MAKRKKQTDDDLTEDFSATATEDFSAAAGFGDDSNIQTDTGVSEDDGFYEMGTILDDETEDKVDIEIREASKKLKKPAAEEDTEDDVEEWREDENPTDNDDFLKDENIDWENYAYEDDEY